MISMTRRIGWGSRLAQWRAATARRLLHAALALCGALMLPSPGVALELAALTEALPPLNYELDGKVTGFSSELLDLIGAEADVTMAKAVLPWARAYERTSREKNTLIYSMVRTPEREPLFQWVGPISARRILLYKHHDRTDIVLKTLDDARPYRIGTTMESDRKSVV